MAAVPDHGGRTAQVRGAGDFLGLAAQADKLLVGQKNVAVARSPFMLTARGGTEVRTEGMKSGLNQNGVG